MCLGARLVGLYLYGSITAGGFDADISDLDLLVVIRTAMSAREFDDLKKLHEDIVRDYPQWKDRLDVAYLPARALQTFKTEKTRITTISPGDPFEWKEAGYDWLINWHEVRRHGVTLFGPSPKDIIAPVSREEFIDAIKAQAGDWREWIRVSRERSRGFHAYAVLTMCRSLYACEFGEQVSKQKAAAWAKEELPEWSSHIDNALQTRTAPIRHEVDSAATFPETSRFVNFVIDKIQSATGEEPSTIKGGPR